jgi:hypothetical protein
MTTNDLLGAGSDFDAGLVDSIDQSSVEGGGPSYPIIQWVYGDLRLKAAGGVAYQGGFFIKADKVDDAAMTAAGWTRQTRTFENGAEEEGWGKREAALCIIAERKRWEVTPADGDRQVFPWSKYDAAKGAANGKGTPHGRTHYLVLVKGLEEIGPFVLTMKGSAGAAFESYRDANAVISRFANTVISAANAASDAAAKKAGKPAGKRWAYRAFWLPVGAARDEKGTPVFKTVGKAPNTTNVVLPVALGLPDKAAQVDLKRFYVGNDLLGKANELFDAAADWRAAWDNIAPGSADNGSAAQEQAQQAATDQEDAVLLAAGL